MLLIVAAAELAFSFPSRADPLNVASALSIKHFAFSTLSGVLTGFATALLTIRFASRIIGVPKGAIFTLVVYSVIQPLFPLVSSPFTPAYAVVGQIAVTIALYGKATLLVTIHWMRYTHRLTYYMVRALELLKEEGPRRNAFVRQLSPRNEAEPPVT